MYLQIWGFVNSIGYVPLSVVVYSRVTLIFVDRIPPMYAGHGAPRYARYCNRLGFLARSGSGLYLGNIWEVTCRTDVPDQESQASSPSMAVEERSCSDVRGCVSEADAVPQRWR